MDETSKALIRRLGSAQYVNTYFVGQGIDIGCGNDSLGKYQQQFPLISSVRPWDLPDGDAQYMSTVEDNTYDFVHSSHCLEHLYDPKLALQNWIRICKPGGHLIITIPDEDLYEQGVWPSNHNHDHKTSWTILKNSSWSNNSVNLVEILYLFRSQCEILKIELINSTFIYNARRIDQTLHGIGECAIEFILRKRTEEEVARKGRLPK